MRDYYAILRVTRSATSAEIKAAYRQIALVVHPDISGPEDKEAADKFKNASEAYSVLNDIEQRRIYDRTLGIRKLNYSAQRWKDAARKAKAERPLYTAKPPPGFKSLDEDVWKAWHYGVNATAEEPITQSNGGWMDLEPGNKHQEYFKRQRAKEKATLGVGRGHRYNSNREKRDLIERVRLRREERLRRDSETQSKTADGRDEEEGLQNACSIS